MLAGLRRHVRRRGAVLKGARTPSVRVRCSWRSSRRVGLGVPPRRRRSHNSPRPARAAGGEPAPPAATRRPPPSPCVPLHPAASPDVPPVSRRFPRIPALQWGVAMGSPARHGPRRMRGGPGTGTAHGRLPQGPGRGSASPRDSACRSPEHPLQGPALRWPRARCVLGWAGGAGGGARRATHPPPCCTTRAAIWARGGAQRPEAIPHPAHDRILGDDLPGHRSSRGSHGIGWCGAGARPAPGRPRDREPLGHGLRRR